MPLPQIVQHTVVLGASALGLKSLNIPMTGAILTTEQGAAWDAIYGPTETPLVASIGPSTYKNALTALGVAGTENLHLALTDMFSQRATSGAGLAPSEALIGRRATPVAQVETGTVNAYEAGTYTVTVTTTPGATVTVFPVPGNTDEPTTAADIRAAIVGIPVTASGAGNNFVLTSDEPGVPFLVSVTHSVTPANISTVLTTANEGIGEDIDLWRDQDDRWHFLLETTGSAGVITTAAQALDALPVIKFGAFKTIDALASNGASSSDLASLLIALGVSQSMLGWNPTQNDYTTHALIGKVAGTLPGVAGFEHQSLASVTGSVFTAAQALALRTKRYTTLERFEATNPPSTSTVGGQMLNGTWADIAWLVADLNVRVQVRVYEALLDGNVPYRGGEDVIENAITGALQERADVLDTTTIEVNVPIASEQSPIDTLERRMAGVTWKATAKGKVSIVVIVGALDQ